MSGENFCYKSQTSMAYTLQSLLAPLVHDDNDWRKRLLREWPDIVGTLHLRMRLEKVAQDTLIIGVYEVHWMQELYMLSTMIRDKINTCLGGPYVVKLRFVLVEKVETNAHKNRKNDNKVISQRPLALPQAECLQRLKDQELRELLKILWHRCTP